MNPRRLQPSSLLLLLVLLAFLGPAGEGWAQKPPPPAKPNPQAPVIAMPGPVGMQRGTALDLTLTGTNLAEPTGLLASFPGKLIIPKEDKNGQDNTKLRVRLEVPADAPLGYHVLQLATTRGMSNVRLFCIDDLPQVLEVDTNRSRVTAQVVPVPCTVVGKLDAEVSDWYKITVKAGQRLSFDVLGHRLGSGVDPQLYLYDAKTGRELAHENDSPGAQTDPRLSYTFKDAGECLIEISDVLNRASADFIYRLRIGDFPLATVPIPMAARRGTKVALQFSGPAVDGVAPVEVTVPTDPAATTMWVAPKGASGLHGWPVALAISDWPEAVEQEPNGELSKANRVAVPGGITGRFQQPADTDYYVFAAKKGQKLAIEVQTLELYSPTLIYMVLRNAKGAEAGKTNPQAVPPADQRLDFVAPEDGDYFVEVQHLNLKGGPDEAYRLTVTPARPQFDLDLSLDRWDVPAGSVLPLIVTANRRGYAGPIDVSVTSPGFKGQTQIAAGQLFGTLSLEAEPSLPPGPHVVALVGKATIDGVVVTEPVGARKSLSDSLGGLAYPPREFYSRVAVAVTPKLPFQLTARLAPEEIVPGLAGELIITVARDAGFAEEVALTPVGGLPPTVKPPVLKPVPKGQNEVKVKLDFDAKTPLGKYVLTLSGKAKVQNKEVTANARPATLTVTEAFELKVEPAAMNLPPGGKAKLKVTAARHGGYEGPIGLELRNLPVKVTVAKAEIPKGQNIVEVEVAAAPDAPPAARADANVLGTAVALANRQAASPNFTVTVNKK